MFKRMNVLNYAVIILLLFHTSCYEEIIINKEDGVVSGEGLADWSLETHSNDVLPNYDVVFPQNAVNRIDLVISSDNWETMLQDLTDNLGEFGLGGELPPFVSPDFKDEYYFESSGNNLGIYPELSISKDNFTPVFSEASVFFNGIEWYNVGVRFKGNSSLRSAWQAGIMKLAFRFDFDEFEDEYPEIKNQRFYGFQKIAFSNNFNDESFLHEKVAADIFRDAGIKAPHTAYYRMYVDYGEGPVYFGLYTAVEIVEDTMLEDQFGSETGNCYKPEGNAATFALGTFNVDELDLKTNEDIADYSDIESLYDILHSSTRTSNVNQWKEELETVFDVNNFMKWLAVNTVIQNWDTYGIMNHNYYLYQNPYTNKLVWIPWDNNEALTEGKRETLSFAMNEVNPGWPLIRYLMNINEYKQFYEECLLSTINGAFEPVKVKETYQYYYNLISEYVVGTNGEQAGYTFLRSSTDFTNALYDQFNHVEERYNEVTNYISE